MKYNFEWDPNKAKTNKDKHGVSFEDACTIFKDPKALTLFDEQHSEYEERWITLGLAFSGKLLVVCHTFKEIDKTDSIIRIFSSRKATKREANNYGEKVMKKEYDFSKAERGKFYHSKIKLNLPVYLDDEALAFVKKIAENKKTEVSVIVNDLIHSDMKLAEVIK